MTNNCPDAPKTSAVALLLRQRLNRLFIEPGQLRLRPDTVIDSVHNFCAVTRMSVSELARENDLRDGFTLLRNTGRIRFVILYNDRQKNLRRRAFTLAHEIGHVYLGHFDDDNAHEAEADLFASELLMPDALLREYIKLRGFPAPEELCGVFNVSRVTAGIRLEKARSERPPLSQPEQALVKRFAGLFPSDTGYLISV